MQVVGCLTLYLIFLHGIKTKKITLVCLTEVILCFVGWQNTKFISIYSTNTNWGLRVNIYSSGTIPVGGGKWLTASRSSRFACGKEIGV